MNLSSVVSVLLSIAAAACIYLFVLNRHLIMMRGARSKSLLIRVGGLLSVGCAGVVGYFAAGTSWELISVAVLGVVTLGEVRRLIIRHQCRGTPPVAAEGAGVTWRAPVTTTDLALYRYEIRVPGWRGPALRIAHVSDFHINSHLPLTYFETAMQRVEAARPDLLFFTGDFVTSSEYVDLLPRVISLARGRLGTFAVLGNHDYWADSTAVTEAVRSAGVTLLGNGSVRVPAGDGPAVLIAGCEAPWSPRPWQPPVPAASDLRLILTHTPDNVYRLSRLGFTAIFAGHYHGGQIRVPGLGSLVVPSKYGRRFDHGHFVMRETHLFVTAGVGSAEPPLRLWCQPDVFIVDIVGQDG